MFWRLQTSGHACHIWHQHAITRTSSFREGVARTFGCPTGMLMLPAVLCCSANGQAADNETMPINSTCRAEPGQNWVNTGTEVVRRLNVIKLSFKRLTAEIHSRSAIEVSCVERLLWGLKLQAIYNPGGGAESSHVLHGILGALYRWALRVPAALHSERIYIL